MLTAVTCGTGSGSKILTSTKSEAGAHHRARISPTETCPCAYRVWARCDQFLRLLSLRARTAPSAAKATSLGAPTAFHFFRPMPFCGTAHQERGSNRELAGPSKASWPDPQERLRYSLPSSLGAFRQNPRTSSPSSRRHDVRRAPAFANLVHTYLVPVRLNCVSLPPTCSTLLEKWLSRCKRIALWLSMPHKRQSRG